VRGVAVGLGVLAITLATLAPWSPPSTAEARERRAARAVYEHGARVQAPQRFLERRWFLRGGQLDTKRHGTALRWLVERYGNVEDENTTLINPESAQKFAKTVKFMGLPVSIHSKIAPALAAVEKRIHRTCTGAASRYTPKAIGGFRTANTYRGAEVSNHLFGIAVDIDPDSNPCCGCVDPWPTNPICKKTGPVYKRTALPRCWIQAFEHFGFDWLGHDKLEDTMHFEFLGDPDKITAQHGGR
jgi:hypothetical protein